MMYHTPSYLLTQKPVIWAIGREMMLNELSQDQIMGDHSSAGSGLDQTQGTEKEKEHEHEWPAATERVHRRAVGRPLGR